MMYEEECKEENIRGMTALLDNNYGTTESDSDEIYDDDMVGSLGDKGERAALLRKAATSFVSSAYSFLSSSNGLGSLNRRQRTVF